MHRGRISKSVKENNFWQQKLAQSGISMQELAQYIGCSYRYTVSYLTGFVCPADETIYKICALFDVEPEVGKQHFYEIHEQWGKDNAENYAKVGNTYKPKHKIRPGYKAKKYVANFWHHKLAGAHISAKAMAEICGVAYPTIVDYLSGHAMPANNIIKIFCKTFNVDFDRAYSEFVKIHEAWGIAHKDKYVAVGNTYKPKVTVRTKPTPVEALEQKANKKTAVHYRALDVTYCMRQVYGELSYEDFIQAMQMCTSYTGFLEFIYGKAECDTFCKLLIK